MSRRKILFVVELVAPDDDGLEGERALAQARDHRLAAGLDALGDRDFALAREQLHRAHLAQIHADRVVGALGRLLGLGLGRDLLLDLDQLVLGSPARRRLPPSSSSLASSVSTTLTPISDEHREDVLDLLGIDLFRGQDGVDLVVGDVAALLGGADELLDRGVRQVEQRERRIRGLGALLLGRLVLDRGSPWCSRPSGWPPWSCSPSIPLLTSPLPWGHEPRPPILRRTTSAPYPMGTHSHPRPANPERRGPASPVRPPTIP